MGEESDQEEQESGASRSLSVNDKSLRLLSRDVKRYGNRRESVDSDDIYIQKKKLKESNFQKKMFNSYSLDKIEVKNSISKTRLTISNFKSEKNIQIPKSEELKNIQSFEKIKEKFFKSGKDPKCRKIHSRSITSLKNFEFDKLLVKKPNNKSKNITKKSNFENIKKNKSESKKPIEKKSNRPGSSLSKNQKELRRKSSFGFKKLCKSILGIKIKKSQKDIYEKKEKKVI